MVIAVASGKGGTGKTTVSTSLAIVAAELASVRFLDCDVEEPNAGFFLNPTIERRTEVGILRPVVDASQCTHCGRCAEVCQFHAIAVIGKKTLVFPELCHGCGSCTMVCGEGAIDERLDVIGILEAGPATEGIEFARGLLNIGEPMAVPIIRQLEKWVMGEPQVVEIRDSPPGASCPVVQSLRGADFALLVTEPTPFGLHDLKQIIEIVHNLGIPAGVVVNRDGIGDDSIDEFCEENNLPILLRIPSERRFAEGLAAGRSLIEMAPEYRCAFEGLLELIRGQAVR